MNSDSQELAPARPERGLFVVGSDTGVGKTYVAELIARQLAAEGTRVGVYKPVVSGVQEDEPDDGRRLWEAAGRPLTLSQVSPQRFAAPLAPHLAARAAGTAVDADRLRSGLADWTDACDLVLVEGAGGLLSPVSDDDYVADLAVEFDYPLVVVVPNVLGVINQTLQTLVTAATCCDGLPIAGVVLNDVQSAADDPSRESNLAELRERCVPPVLAHVAHGAKRFSESIDWRSLAAVAAAEQS